MTEDFQAITRFIVEIEKLKNVERKIKPAGLSRYENSAEHSWQIALLALTLLPYAEKQTDPLTVVTMLLLHDIVEIDTGDKFAYDANHDDYENELLSAKRIFAILPDEQQQTYLKLWIEFEHAQTPEAQFAKAIDRLMPVLQNLHNGCQSWIDHDVSVTQILHKNAAIEIANPLLWQWLKRQVIEAGERVGLSN
ncbi:HD domain-containing protein [Paraglaciecola arctica]|uniref:HD domain-containing protein n=1 Tax=Paraglaciecola arctica TaxID=1128911 RepID=UPI001C0696F7|nr:HD domain-containing protein [Paraglaciecola arctica]MBU3002199.1 HD domain-containing protein [Paraglaciecola arctica]